MLDIRLFRENPDELRARLATRAGGFDSSVDEVLAVDAERRRLETRVQDLNGQRKRLSKEIGQSRAKGEASAGAEDRVRLINAEIEEIQWATDAANARQRDLLLRIPNLPHASVPPGASAQENAVVRAWGEPAKPVFAPADHIALGQRLGLFEFERAAKISGGGYVCFTGMGARLQRALVQFMLDLHTREHGYFEVSPPVLVRRICMEGTGQLPKFEDDMYGLDGGEIFLAPTAEVPVTNLRRDEILAESELPVRYAAHTPCFRREAGSAGTMTRGMIRIHQFDKIELVKIVAPDTSYDEHEKLTADAERVLQLLGLHYRVLNLCAGDLGFCSAKTYDLEVWAPGQAAYLEVSSCSNFEDYQARRMNLRFKDAEKKNRFCHTLNGSGVALPRLYVALLETHQQADGSVRVPEPLRDYLKADRIG